MASDATLLQPSAVPVLSLGAYSAGDLVGTSLVFNIAPFLTRQLTGMRVTAVQIIDSGDIGADLDLVLFKNRTFTSTLTDNAAAAINAADSAFMLGMVSIVAADYVDVGSGKMALKSGLSIPFNFKARKPLKGILIARSTPTFPAVNNLTVTLTVEPA